MVPNFADGHSDYENCYLSFLCIALIITFLYLVLVVLLALISESGNVINFVIASNVNMISGSRTKFPGIINLIQWKIAGQNLPPAANTAFDHRLDTLSPLIDRLYRRQFFS